MEEAVLQFERRNYDGSRTMAFFKLKECYEIVGELRSLSAFIALLSNLFICLYRILRHFTRVL